MQLNSGLDYILDGFEESIRDVMDAIIMNLKGWCQIRLHASELLPKLGPIFYIISGRNLKFDLMYKKKVWPKGRDHQTYSAEERSSIKLNKARGRHRAYTI